MSSHSVNQPDKAALLRQVQEILGQRRDHRRMGVFAQAFYRRIEAEDLCQYPARALAAAATNLVRFMGRRSAGELLLRVFNPDQKHDGWLSEHTVIEMINDDMPFLVDSANLAMAEMGLGVHIIVHPVLRVERDAAGRLRDIHAAGGTRGKPESVMQIQVERQTDPEVLATIASRLRRAMHDVRAAVEDWPQMRERAQQAVALMPGWAAVCEDDVLEESRAFVAWMVEDHFIFLGCRDYAVVRESGSATLDVVPGSGLGVLRETDRTIHSRPLATLSETARLNRDNPLIITKTRQRGVVHRAGYMDYIGVLRFSADGQTIGERRFIGLFTSNAYFRRVSDTPLVRRKQHYVLQHSGLSIGSHAYKSLTHIVETLPRDELFQATAPELLEISTRLLNLQERRRVRLLVRRERFSRYFSCLVYIPRDRFNTENRERIQDILFQAFKGEQLDYEVQVSDSTLALLHVIIRPRPGSDPQPDVRALEHKIVEAVRSWHDVLEEILVEKYGEETGLAWSRGISQAFPAAYVEDVSPWVASFDVERIASLGDASDLKMSLYRPRARESDLIRFKIFKRGAPVPLSEVLPMLESLGLHIVSERPYELEMADGQTVWVQDFDMVYARGEELQLDAVRDSFQEAFENTWRGVSASDNFNRLVLAALLHWRQVKLLRAYCKYLLQTGMPFSLAYMADTMARHPLLARLLWELFDALFNPARDSESDYRRELARKYLQRDLDSLQAAGGADDDPVLREYLTEAASARGGSDREAQVAALKEAFVRGLAGVSSLDEDRILHAFYSVILSTLRSNFYLRDAAGALREYLSFKLDPARVPDLPRPRPYREIWVYSPRFEGIHLRCGPIARGGLRWSDRKEDFRTEVLGLMKAQNVKNTMIVPVGAKGGFVPQHLPTGAGRDAIQREGIVCYTSFINGLLDITDNLDEDRILPPDQVVRRDGDDPYLVVAADKGTATFSDTANAVALERGFWLGDAFASGGSVGYDHKAMGITAKGAWEGVKRHFRELGRDIQKQAFTVVGIGDMSGDVFGNGMLLSRHIRLQAAFNHQHIFLDPDPDPAASFRERKRLFKLPRSSWADYDPALISAGGGVFPRTAKTIALSREVRDWLGVEARELAPFELIRALLTAEVDLLWNGGIGTYVKSSRESNAEVGDLANNALRVNGNELRCRVVGEGGNLGFTQLGRIEFAQGGGRINTDFIDNSAGVDCSDHEVNIKILLNLALRNGQLDPQQRTALLAGMTDEVAVLVQRSNYLQTQAISMMERLTGARLGSKQRFISVLEDEGQLDRKLEFLPDDEELLERRNRGEGLSRPELSVLLSYSKIRLYQQLLESDIPEDPFLSTELRRYFPAELGARFGELMDQHRLRREIIATQVTNSLVNRMGVSFVVRMRDDTGATPGEVARAYSVAREIFDARDYWTQVEALDGKVDASLQTDAHLVMWGELRQLTRWLARTPGQHRDIEHTVRRLKPGVQTLQSVLGRMMDAGEKARVAELEAPFLAGGFPRKLARRVAMLHLLFPLLDVVETAAESGLDVVQVATVAKSLSATLGLKWLRRQLEDLRVQGQWHAQARANLRDELYDHQRELALCVIRDGEPGPESVARWRERHRAAVQRVTDMLDDMRSLPAMDYATLAVAVGALGQLKQAVRERAAT